METVGGCHSSRGQDIIPANRRTNSTHVPLQASLMGFPLRLPDRIRSERTRARRARDRTPLPAADYPLPSLGASLDWQSTGARMDIERFALVGSPCGFRIRRGVHRYERADRDRAARAVDQERQAALAMSGRSTSGSTAAEERRHRQRPIVLWHSATRSAWVLASTAFLIFPCYAYRKRVMRRSTGHDAAALHLGVAYMNWRSL